MTQIPLTLFKSACIGTILLGLVGAAAALPALAGPWQLFVDAVKWPVDGGQSVASSEARLLSAISGGLTVGLGVMMLSLAQGPLGKGEAWAKRAILQGLTTWVLVDSTASFLAGWPENVLLNLVFYAMLAGPVFALKADRG